MFCFFVFVFGVADTVTTASGPGVLQFHRSDAQDAMSQLLLCSGMVRSVTQSQNSDYCRTRSEFIEKHLI